MSGVITLQRAEKNVQIKIPTQFRNVLLCPQENRPVSSPTILPSSEGRQSLNEEDISIVVKPDMIILGLQEGYFQ